MEKEKKVKKSKYPEGYIGRPKPMKSKTFEIHKPTKKFWIGLAFALAIIGFLTYIVIRLIQVENVVQPPLEYYETGKLSYITHMVDSGFLTVTLTEFNNFSPFQKLAFQIIHNEIRKWRSRQKPLVTI